MSVQKALTNGQWLGIACVRFVTGALMAYHGWEIFTAAKMNEYLQWEMFRDMSFAKTMVYAGKAAELVGGVSLALGLFTRAGALIIMFTLSYIAFSVGNGKIWYQDQHPFLFVLLALLFLILGPGPYSLDSIFRKK